MMNPSNSCYDRYRDQLQHASSDTWKTGLIKTFSDNWPEWDASKIWHTCYGRFNPDCEPYMTILLQQSDFTQHLCLIEIFKQKPELQNGALLYYDKDLGWICPKQFPDDPKLPHLVNVLNALPNAEVLRYRPYKRCTFSLQPEQNSDRVIGKQFADNRGAQIFSESQRLWNAACEGRLNFTVAKPIRWEIKTQTLWQHAIEGQPLVNQLFSAEGISLAARIGQAAASMTKSEIQTAFHFDGQAQMQRSIKYAQELARRIPDLSESLSSLLDSLQQLHAKRTAYAVPKPLHGAPHAHQWLECGNYLGLVDFDRTCLGDPELDAATFIAEMDFENRQEVPVDEINSAFLEAYQHTAGKLNRHLLAAYRSHKRLAKALKAARSIRVNGDRKARKHLSYAHQAITDINQGMIDENIRFV